MKPEDLVVVAATAVAAVAMMTVRYVVGLVWDGGPAPAPGSKAPSGDGRSGAGQPGVTPEERQRMIAERAHERAAARGFAEGDPMQDWLEAEKEVEARLKTGLH